MNSANVLQMFGYVVPTWFGFGGWLLHFSYNLILIKNYNLRGIHKYFIEMPNQFSFIQSFFANYQILLDTIQNKYKNYFNLTFEQVKNEIFIKEECKGLLYDREVVAFYGDPLWDARLENIEKFDENKSLKLPYE